MRDGRDGRDGEDGESAYDLAVKEQRFSGTRGEWLRSLRGDTGARGPKGDAGPQGLRGIPGAPGEPGKAGRAGTKGERGPQGERGPEGPVGPPPEHEWQGTKLRFQHPDGEWGQAVDLKGPTGDRGLSGFVSVGGTGSGEVGPTGPTGPAGDASFKTGFSTRTDSVLAFDAGTRTFSIAPTGASYSTFVNGTETVHTTTSSIVIPNTTGPSFIYFDKDTGVLSRMASFDLTLITDHVYVATIWWDAVGGVKVHGGDERHGFMPSETHIHFHTTLGALYVQDGGLGVTDMVVDGDGSTDAQAQIGIANGSIRDEDIRHDLSGFAVPAVLPIIYYESGSPKRVDGDDFPVIHNGKGGWAGTRIAYQGASGLLEAPNNTFVLMHLFVTNDWTAADRAVAVVGGNYQTKSAARLAAGTEIMALDDLPWLEFVPIATLILQARNTDTNTPKCHFVSTEDGYDYVDWRAARSMSGVGTESARVGVPTYILSSSTDPLPTGPAIVYVPTGTPNQYTLEIVS